ncbi:MAG: hypothetical protein QM725_18110 [Lacibacter sp.]
MRITIFSVLIILLLTSCYSYKIFPKEYRNPAPVINKINAFVVNPELTKEYEILKSAEIYTITTDSNLADIQVKLYKIEKLFVCGQPAIGSLITLGQIPVYLPDKYFFTIDEIRKGEITKTKFELRIATRIWFWDMFNFKKNFNQKAGQCFRGNYYELKKEKVVGTDNTGY